MAALTLGTTKEIWNFDPRSIGGCALWLDAADTTTLSLAGTSVTTWRDKSGAGNNATIGIAAAPTYTSATKSVDFNGTSNYMLTSLSSGVNQEAIFMVISNVSTTTGAFMAGSVTFTTNRMIQISRSKIITVKINTSEFLNSTVSLGTGLNIISSENPGTNVTGSVVHYLNGTSATGVNGTVSAYTTGQGTAIGAQINAASSAYVTFFSGRIHELLVFQNATLTSANRQAIEGYLANKWGLKSSVPATHPYKTLPSPTSINFTPLSVPNCSLWLDAADSASYTLNVSTLTLWRDKSGIGNNSSSIVGTPTYSATGLNNLPAFSLTGSSAIIGPNTNTTGGLTVFVVATMNNAGTNSNGRLLSLGASGVADSSLSSYAGAITRSTTTQALIARRGASNLSTLALPAYDTAFIASTVFNGTNNVLYTNGTTGTTVTSTGNFNYLLYGIGRDPGTGTAYWHGFVSEVIVYSRAITLSERLQIEGYLANKWNIRTSLAAAQPFRSYLLPSSLVFVPSLLTNALSAWWDGRDPNNNVASIPADGSSITTWVDKSGNALNLTGTGPTYSFAQGAVTFTATQTLASSLSGALSNETMFIVASLNLASYNPSASTIITPSANGGRQLYVDTNGKWSVARRNVVEGAKTIASVPLNQYNILVFLNTGNTITMSFNGGTRTSAGITAFAASTTAVGQSTNGWAGRIREIVSFPAALNLNDIQRVEGYLAWKWGLTNVLPTTHPYYKIKP